jgi:hypothetical protein
MLFFPSVAGGGVIRLQDGTLLTFNLMQPASGGDRIDLDANEGHCTLTLQITGGTGRFKLASGVLAYTETAVPVLADASNTNPVLFTETGGITGTVSRLRAD